MEYMPVIAVAYREARGHRSERGAACALPGLLLSILCACHPEALRAPQVSEKAGVLRYHVTFVREPQHALEVGILRGGEGAPLDFLFT